MCVCVLLVLCVLVVVLCSWLLYVCTIVAMYVIFMSVLGMDGSLLFLVVRFVLAVCECCSRV